MKLQVIKSFKDKETKEVYEVGAEIELTEVNRINDVVARGFCQIVEIGAKEPADNGEILFFEQFFEKSKVVEALKVVGVKGNVQAMKPETLQSKVAELDEADLAKFKEAILSE